MTETIASGFESAFNTIAPEPFSFTKALIEVLAESIDESFSAAMLHSRVLGYVKHKRLGEKSPQLTPIYVVTTNDNNKPSITLSRLQPNSQQSNLAPVNEQRHPSSPSHDATSNKQNNSLITPLDRERATPHVLISVALEQDQLLDAKATANVEEWIRSFPALAKHVHVQGVYRSYSTLLLLSLDVTVWNCLAEHPACAFIGYVRSDNLLDNAPVALEQQHRRKQKPPAEWSWGWGEHASTKFRRWFIANVDFSCFCMALLALPFTLSNAETTEGDVRALDVLWDCVFVLFACTWAIMRLVIWVFTADPTRGLGRLGSRAWTRRARWCTWIEAKFGQGWQAD
jgi:hypothetical protein